MEGRVYRTDIKWLVLTVGAGCLLVLGGLAGIMGFRYGLLNYLPTSVVVVFSIASIAMGGFMAIGMLTNRVVLNADEIEVGCIFPFATRRMKKSAIAAKVSIVNTIQSYVLIPTDKKEKNLPVGIVFTEDEYFRDWMSTIPTVSAAHLNGPARQNL
jgi:hypothetical protein